MKQKSPAPWSGRQSISQTVGSSNYRARKRGAIGHISTQEWREKLEQCGYRCVKCGTDAPLTIDHIVPLRIGGTHTIDNVQPLCLTCNLSKGVRGTQVNDFLAARALLMERHGYSAAEAIAGLLSGELATVLLDDHDRQHAIAVLLASDDPVLQDVGRQLIAPA